jgi:hypothetical protein
VRDEGEERTVNVAGDVGRERGGVSGSGGVGGDHFKEIEGRRRYRMKQRGGKGKRGDGVEGEESRQRASLRC